MAHSSTSLFQLPPSIPDNNLSIILGVMVPIVLILLIVIVIVTIIIYCNRQKYKVHMFYMDDADNNVIEVYIIITVTFSFGDYCGPPQWYSTQVKNAAVLIG